MINQDFRKNLDTKWPKLKNQLLENIPKHLQTLRQTKEDRQTEKLTNKTDWQIEHSICSLKHFSTWMNYWQFIQNFNDFGWYYEITKMQLRNCLLIIVLTWASWASCYLVETEIYWLWQKKFTPALGVKTFMLVMMTGFPLAVCNSQFVITFW